MIAVSCAGVWQTRDGGRTWANTSRGMIADYMPPERKEDGNIQDVHRVSACAAQPDALWLQHHGGMYRSTDGGAAWETLNTGYKGQLYGALGVRNEAGAEDIVAFGFKGNVFRLPAGSKAWEPVASGTNKNLTGGVVLPNGEPAIVSQDGRLLLGSDHGRHLRTVAGTPFPSVAITLLPGGVAIAGMGGVKTISFDATSGATKP